MLERRESLEEAEERRRQLAARLALGLEPGKRKPEEIPIPPAEAYIVTPHRKRRPGFHNAPAQNPAFVPFNPGFETPRRLQAPRPLSVSTPPYLVRVIKRSVVAARVPPLRGGERERKREREINGGVFARLFPFPAAGQVGDAARWIAQAAKR